MKRSAADDKHQGRTVTRDFRQIEWSPAVEEDCRQIVRLAVREDLDRLFDWTTVCLVPGDAMASARIVARYSGTIAGLRAGQLAATDMDAKVSWQPLVEDGSRVVAGQTVVEWSGAARSLLTAERIVLNLIGRLSGIATLTSRYVAAVAHTKARIYDTRKTTPGYRLLEKYAVRLGGGRNHRTGLYDAILIKDNHLALAASEQLGRLSPADAVRRAREFVASMAPAPSAPLLIEVEVDTLAQLENVLQTAPDLILLDNMPPDTLRAAVAMRDRLAPAVELEASGGVTLDSVAAIAETGVDRISAGSLTHSAPAFDVALDWN